MKFSVIVALFILALSLSSVWIGLRIQNMQAAGKATALAKKLSGLPEEVAVPVFVGSELDKLSIATHSATAVLVTDQQSQVQLLEKDSAELRYPASTMKLMTALVARKVYPLDKVLTVREEAFATGTVIGFQVGEQLTVRDLLAVLLMHSGNDAAFVLANNSPGTYAGFVAEMNETAKSLGLKNTHFLNASGLDEDTQQSTAEDLTILTRAALEDPVIRELVGTKQLTVTDTTGQVTHQLVNRNELLGKLPGVFGVKTGTTEFAGENLITAVKKDEREYLIVMLGSMARYPETEALITWLNQNYRWETRSSPQ